MDRNMYGITIVDERTSRELIDMLITPSIFGESLNINHNTINRMIDETIEYFPYGGTINQKKELLRIILNVEENFIIKVIQYLNYYSPYFGFREWKNLILFQEVFQLK